MLLDNTRTTAYDSAIRNAIRRKQISGIPKVHLLDAGAGSGLLSMLAARNGANLVSAVEFPGHVADLCEENVLLNGLFSTIRVIPKAIQNVTASQEDGSDLKSKADILAMEVFDCGLIGEGALHIIKHAQEHLLHKDAICIPCGASVFVQPVQLDRIGALYGFDFQSVNAYRWRPEYESINLEEHHGHDLKPLSDPAMAFSFDFYDVQSCMDNNSMDIHLTSNQEGILNGVLFWFDLYLDEEETLSTGPNRQGGGTTWSVALQWLQERKINKGDHLHLQATHDTYGFRFEVFSPSSGATGIPLCTENWKTKFDETQSMRESLMKGISQSPEAYRHFAHTAIKLASRAGDFDVNAPEAAQFCARLMQ